MYNIHKVDIMIICIVQVDITIDGCDESDDMLTLIKVT